MRAAALLAAVILCSGCRASPTESSSSASSSAASSVDTQSLAQASDSGFVSGGGPWSGGVPGTSGLNQSPGVPGSGGPSSNEDGNDDDDDDGSPGSDLRHAFLLSQLGHHHNRRICIPEIVAFSLLPKGDSAGLFKGALGMWPFHHLNSHKLQELLYLTALSKLLPQQQQAFPFRDDKISNPLAKIQHPTLLKLPTAPVKL